MSGRDFFFTVLITFAWGTTLSLPGLPLPGFSAELSGAMAPKEAKVPAADLSRPSTARVRKPYTAPLVMNRRLVLKLRERRVYLHEGNQVLASYPVAIGKKGWETPTGDFKVIQKVRNPAWKNPWSGQVIDPGPRSALGERWIGFWTDGKNSIGFHGTPGEHLLGQAVSHGCVRMRNADIKLLFDMVEVGTPVIVHP
jgi:lipoprotein-anchoring transpeptidase ErfK/SrfK